MKTQYYLRAASAHRCDLFEGGIITADGVTKITGATVQGRESYYPHEVFIVPVKLLDELRGIISETQYALRVLQGVDADVTFQKDQIEMVFSERVSAFIKRNSLKNPDGWQASSTAARVLAGL